MWVGGADEVTHVITVGEDITDRVEANRAVARAEKLAAVGRLAAGVVHEINNPLATISACAEALESRLQEGAFDASPARSDLREYLGLIRSEAYRCKTITTGLLNFSRTRTVEDEPVNIAEVISSVARLVSHQHRGEPIDIRIEAQEDLADVSGDAGQLQQAIIALATNAIDAMPAGGTLPSRPLTREARFWSKLRTQATEFRLKIYQKSLSHSSRPKRLVMVQVLGSPSVMVS
jgi:two-component system NtrC family sensor kinase